MLTNNILKIKIKKIVIINNIKIIIFNKLKVE